MAPRPTLRVQAKSEQNQLGRIKRTHKGIRARSGPAGTMRFARRDFELRGKPIRRGKMLMLSFSGANRDAAVYENPDRLDLDRNVRDFLLFGKGATLLPRRQPRARGDRVHDRSAARHHHAGDRASAASSWNTATWDVQARDQPSGANRPKASDLTRALVLYQDSVELYAVLCTTAWASCSAQASPICVGRSRPSAFGCIVMNDA
jgi:hypothetical protein